MLEAIASDCRAMTIVLIPAVRGTRRALDLIRSGGEMQRKGGMNQEILSYSEDLGHFDLGTSWP